MKKKAILSINKEDENESRIVKEKLREQLEAHKKTKKTLWIPWKKRKHTSLLIAEVKVQNKNFLINSFKLPYERIIEILNEKEANGDIYLNNPKCPNFSLMEGCKCE